MTSVAEFVKITREGSAVVVEADDRYPFIIIDTALADTLWHDWCESADGREYWGRPGRHAVEEDGVFRAKYYYEGFWEVAAERINRRLAAAGYGCL